MEKISQIVRGSSRVASTDMKSASAIRPGTPSFGRPMGESVGPSSQVGSTASRAVALHKELEDKKTSQNSQMVGQLADQFFMNRVRRPADPSELVGVEDGAPVTAPEVDAELAPPSGYTPRGTFVDYNA